MGWEDMLREILYLVLITAIPIVCKFVIDLLRVKVDAFAVDIENTLAGKLLDDAVELVEKAVDTVAQTYVDDLKKAGTFDEKAQAEALKKAVTATKELLAPELENFIKESYNDVEAWIKLQIESYIKATKPTENQEIILG